MTEVFKTVLETSVSVGIVALMVIAARLIIGRRPNNILPWLYALLIIRLAIPVNVPSPLSIQNLFNAPNVKVEQILEAPDKSIQNGSIQDLKGVTVPEPNKADNIQKGENAVQTTNSTIDTIPAVINENPSLSITDICEIIWLSGIAAFSIIMLLGNMRFIRRLRRNRGYDSPGFDELLTYCKSELGLRKSIKAIQVSDINTAAVYGAFKTKLLISPSFEALSETQKRHVLLHELSHIKRRDNLICLAASFLSIVYWFNPLVWAAFILMRKDIEVMCDVTALKKIDNKRGYALTLLNLASASSSGKPRFVSALFISTDAIKRRIKMIVSNKKNSVLFMVVGIILVLSIAVCGCTGAAQPTKAQQSSASRSSINDGVSITIPEELNNSIKKRLIEGNGATVNEGSNAVLNIGSFTLKDGSITVAVPEGWESKDHSKDGYSYGSISNKNDDDYFSIQTDKLDNSNETPDSIMNNTGFGYSEGDEKNVQSEQIYPSIVSSTELSVDGIQGKLFEISATIKFNGAKKQGYLAVFVGNGKLYTAFYLTDPNIFEKNKDVVKNAISSAKFNSITGTVFTLKNGSMSITVPDGWTAVDFSSETSSAGGIMSQDSADIQIATRELQKGENETPDSIIEKGPSLKIWSDKIGELTPLITSESNMSVDGIEGKRYEFSAVSSSYEMYGDLWLFVRNGKVYSIVYMAGKDIYTKESELVNKMVLSAKFN